MITSSDLPTGFPEGTSPRLQIPQEISCEPNCPICHGVGYVHYDLPIGHPKFGRVFPCDNAVRLYNQRTKVFGTLDERVGVTMDELRQLSWGLVLPNSELGKHLKTIQAIFRRGWGMITLMGGYGNGKTLLLKLLVTYALNDGRRAAYANTTQMLDDIRLAYDHPDSMHELKERMAWWGSLDVLCVDEIDKINSTAWAQERLFALFDTRYELAVQRRALTALAGNLSSLDELPGYLRSRLEDNLFADGLIFLSGVDYRKSRPRTKDTEV